jgi:hypothetical protein
LNKEDIIFFGRSALIFANSKVKRVEDLTEDKAADENPLEKLLESGQCLISHRQYKFTCQAAASRTKRQVAPCPKCKSKNILRLVHTCTAWRQGKKSRECPKGRCWKCWNAEVTENLVGLDKKKLTTALSIYTFSCFPESPPELKAMYKLISPIDCFRHESGQRPLLIEDLASYKFDTESCFFPYPDGFCMSNCLFLMMWNGSEDFYDHEKAWSLLKDKILEWEVAGQITPELSKDLTRGDLQQYSNPDWTLIEDEEVREDLGLSPFSYEGALPLLCKNLGMGLAMMDDPWNEFRVVHPATSGSYLVRCTIPRSKSIIPEHFEKIRHFFIARPKEDYEMALDEHDDVGDIQMGRVHDDCKTVDLAQENEAEKQTNSDESSDVEMGGVEDEGNLTRETYGEDVQVKEHLAERSNLSKGKNPSRDDLAEVESDLKEVGVPNRDEELELSEGQSSGWDILDEERPQGITNGKNQDLEFLGLGRLDPRGLNEDNVDEVGMAHEVAGQDDGMQNQVTGPELVPDMIENPPKNPDPNADDPHEVNEDQGDLANEVARQENMQNRVVELEAELPDVKENLPNQPLPANNGGVEQENEGNLHGFGNGNAQPILPKKAATNQISGPKQGINSNKKRNKRSNSGKGKGKGKGLGYGGGLKREIGSNDLPRIVPDYSISSTPEVIVGDRSAIMTTCVFFLDGWVPEEEDVSFMVDQLKAVSLKFGRRITLSFSKNRRNLFKDLRFCANQTLIREVIVFGHGVQGPGETNGVLGAEVRILNKEARACEVIKFDEIIASFIRNSRSFQPDVGFVCCNYFRRKRSGKHLKRRYTNAVSEKFQAMLTVCVEEDISLHQTTVKLPEILESFISAKTFPFRFWKPSFKVQEQWKQFRLRKFKEEKLFIFQCLRKCEKHQILCVNSSWLYQYLGLQWKDVNFDWFQIVHCMVREREASVQTKQWLYLE